MPHSDPLPGPGRRDRHPARRGRRPLVRTPRVGGRGQSVSRPETPVDKFSADFVQAIEFGQIFLDAGRAPIAAQAGPVDVAIGALEAAEGGLREGEAGGEPGPVERLAQFEQAAAAGLARDQPARGGEQRARRGDEAGRRRLARAPARVRRDQLDQRPERRAGGGVEIDQADAGGERVVEAGHGKLRGGGGRSLHRVREGVDKSGGWNGVIGGGPEDAADVAGGWSSIRAWTRGSPRRSRNFARDFGGNWPEGERRTLTAGWPSTSRPLFIVSYPQDVGSRKKQQYQCLICMQTPRDLTVPVQSRDVLATYSSGEII